MAKKIDHVMRSPPPSLSSGDDISTTRLLSICCVYEDSEKAIIAIGTSSGLIFLVKIVRRIISYIDKDEHHEDGGTRSIHGTTSGRFFNIEIMNEFVLALNGSPTVHDLTTCSFQHQNNEFDRYKPANCNEQELDNAIVIGHSNGLTIWNMRICLDK